MPSGHSSRNALPESAPWPLRRCGLPDAYDEESTAHPMAPHRRCGTGRRGGRGAACDAGPGLAEVLLRPTGLAPVRRYHRAGRVLPDPHRSRDLRAARGGHRSSRAGAHRPGPADGRLGGWQLRQGGAAVRPAGAAPLRGSGHLGAVSASGAARAAARTPGARPGRRGPGLLGKVAPADTHGKRIYAHSTRLCRTHKRV
jgi:hypothetical protein